MKRPTKLVFAYSLFLLSNDGGKTMRKVLVLSFCLLFALSSIALARQAPKGTAQKQIKVEKGSVLDLDRPLDEQGLFSTAQTGTTWICPPGTNIDYTFDAGAGCTREGWVSVDLTEQPGCYWHVADATELNGGTFGSLNPLSGLQSLWCGAAPPAPVPVDKVLCGYAKLPGYGNDWDQGWCFKCIEVPDTEEVYICYDVMWDSEPGYDYTYVEYATATTCDDLDNIDDIPSADWVQIPVAANGGRDGYDNWGGPMVTCDTIPAGHEGSIRIRFRFSSDGAWSDQDGLWDTDGAILIDDLSVSAQYAGLYDFEDFEYNPIEGGENPGDQQTADSDWECCLLSGYGDYAGLYQGIALLQEDPCNLNLTCMWAFINGSTVNYACGGHPEQIAVPYENTRGQYIQNEIWSPECDWVGIGSVAELQFDVYRDLPLVNLMFYQWHIRSIDAAGCPGGWRDRNFVYYGGNKDWIRTTFSVGDLVEGDAVKVQLALAVVDMCPYWYYRYGDCACHSHSPLFDNVEFYRLPLFGPQWSVRDIDLFNDTFPTNGTAVGTGRIDMALDRLPNDNPGILPGDSAVVLCSDPTSGLLEPEPYTGYGSAVYFYMYRDPETKAMDPSKVEADAFRWPLVDSVLCDGHKWYMFRCDTVFTQPPRGGNRPDAFCIDLNDDYFENGDTLWFFFGAENTINQWSWWSQGSGVTNDINEACEAPMEMQILPARGAQSEFNDILYVDNFSGRGGQNYFDDAFTLLGIFDQVDRFDKRGPSSLVSNAIGDRVKSVANQLHPFYRKIIWNSGDLSVGTVGDGGDEKADDYAALFTFLDQHPNTFGAGIYFSGDDLAEELAGMTSPSSQQFKNVYMNHILITGDHTTLHRISPYGIGEGSGTGVPPSYGIFDHGPPFGVDTIVVFGGCPIINDFDVIAPFGPSTLEMCYDPVNEADDTNPAVIAQASLNSLGIPVRTVLSGFSFHYIRDDRPAGIPDRADHMWHILLYLQNILDEPIAVKPGTGYTNSLAQNYPNPFNPSTTIKYSIKDNAYVSLKIYNVAGQLVRTLVNSDMKAGAYTETWKGLNNSGNPVSSGVYFYKLVTKDFSMTKKMVLLK
jgi:hypothetical protein